MENTMNIYERINNLIAYMSYPEFDATIRSLSAALNLPEGLIENDIETLTKSKYTKNLINVTTIDSIKHYKVNASMLTDIIVEETNPMGIQETRQYINRFSQDTTRLLPVTYPEYKYLKSNDELANSRIVYPRTNPYGNVFSVNESSN